MCVCVFVQAVRACDAVALPALMEKAEAMTLSAWMDSQQFCFRQLISQLKPLVNPPLPSNNGGDNGGSNGGATPNKRARIFGP